MLPLIPLNPAKQDFNHIPETIPESHLKKKYFLANKYSILSDLNLHISFLISIKSMMQATPPWPTVAAEGKHHLNA